MADTSSLDVPSIDAYVSSLIASGAVEEGQFYAWTTPSGEVYYGPSPRRQRVTVPRTQQDIDPLPDVPTEEDVAAVTQLLRQLETEDFSYGDSDPGQLGSEGANEPIGFYDAEGNFTLNPNATVIDTAIAIENAISNAQLGELLSIGKIETQNETFNTVANKVLDLARVVISPAAAALGAGINYSANQLANDLGAALALEGTEAYNHAIAALDALTNENLAHTANAYQNQLDAIAKGPQDEKTSTLQTNTTRVQHAIFDMLNSTTSLGQARVDRAEALARSSSIFTKEQIKALDGANPYGAEGSLTSSALNALGYGHLDAKMGFSPRAGGGMESVNFPGGYSVSLQDMLDPNSAWNRSGTPTSETETLQKPPASIPAPQPRWAPGFPHRFPQGKQKPPTPIPEPLPGGASERDWQYDDPDLSPQDPNSTDPGWDPGGPTPQTDTSTVDTTFDGGAEYDSDSMGWGTDYDWSYHEGGLINKNSKLLGGEGNTTHNYKPLADAHPMFHSGGQVKQQANPYAAFQQRANQQTKQMMQPAKQQPAAPGQGNVPKQPAPGAPKAAAGAPKASGNVNITAKKGEFIIPVDVVKIKGTEFFEKAIAGARKSHFEATGRRNAQKGQRMAKNISRFDPNAPKTRRNPMGLPKIAGATPSPGTPPVSRRPKRPVPGARPTSPVSKPDSGGPLRQPILS